MGYVHLFLVAYVAVGVFMLVWNAIVWLHYYFDWD